MEPLLDLIADNLVKAGFDLAEAYAQAVEIVREMTGLPSGKHPTEILDTMHSDNPLLSEDFKDGFEYPIRGRLSNYTYGAAVSMPTYKRGTELLASEDIPEGTSVDPRLQIEGLTPEEWQSFMQGLDKAERI